MATPPICPGSQLPTDRRDSTAMCPKCGVAKPTLSNGRLRTHLVPVKAARCAALAYQKGWPGQCSRNAIKGSRYCRQHGAAA